LNVLLHRGGLIVSPGCLEIGRTLHNLNDIREVDVCERRQGESLVWAIYSGLGGLAFVQGAAASNLTLGLLAVGLALFAHLTWQRRDAECTFEIVLSKGGEASKFTKPSAAKRLDCSGTL
jgi:hypothetical protein